MKNEVLLPDNKPLVSIIIATLNTGSNISACLSSIAAQSNKNIEIIIVDGGSTDNTIDIIKQFANDNKLLWISEPDKGIYDALNKGLQLATGKWLYFLGADDTLSDGFSKLLAQLKDYNTIYYGNCEPFYEGEDPGYTILNGEFSKYRLCKVCINHQSIIYPAKAFAKYKYNLRYKVFADWALNIKLWGDDSFSKQYYPITLARYNLKGFSSLHKDEAFERDKPMLIKKYMGWLLYLRYRFKQFKKKI